jgi:hypothetical protein
MASREPNRSKSPSHRAWADLVAGLGEGRGGYCSLPSATRQKSQPRVR